MAVVSDSCPLIAAFDRENLPRSPGAIASEEASDQSMIRSSTPTAPD